MSGTPRLRILVADSESATERTLVDTLNKGLSECVAVGLHDETSLPEPCSMDALCGLLKTHAWRHKCHLVVIDRALLGKKELDSWSRLSEALGPTQCVLHVGDSVRTLDVVRAFLAGLLVSPIKRHAPSHKALDTLTKQAVWQRRAKRLAITPFVLLSEIAREISQANDIVVPEHEVQELFEYLFPKADSVSLTIIPVGLLASVPRGHSVLLQVTEQDDQRHVRLPVVLKIARRDKIEEEVKNYQDHIKGHLKGMRHTYLESYDLRWEIGGIVYSLLGADAGLLKPFADHYEEYLKNLEDGKPNQDYVHKLLEEIFGGIWSKHYTESRERSSGKLSVYELYSTVWQMADWLEDSSEDRRKEDNTSAAEELASRWEEFQLPAEYSALPDPFLWVSQNKERLSPRNSYKAITHGDLHPRNVLVDDKENCWLIDFERTGPGPILQDFTELHFNILTRYDLVEPQTGEIPLLYDLYVAVATPQTPEGDIPLPQPFLQFGIETALQKTLATSNFLHRLAHRIIPYSDCREYLWGLLLNALYLNASKLPAQATESDKAVRRRALLLASVICGRLDKWRDAEHPPKTWPPSGWPSVGMIDEQRPPDALTAAPRISAPRSVAAIPTLKMELTDLPNERHEFKVRVALSSNEQPHATSKLPYNDNELVSVMKLFEPGQNRLDDFYDYQIAALQELGLLTGGVLVEDWTDRVGRAMYAALVPAIGGVRTAFDGVLSRSPRGGNLQLTFDAEAAGLAGYPWELIHDGDQTDPEPTDINVVRYITSKRPARELEVPFPEKPCRVLYISARPDDASLPQAALDRDAVKNSIASFPQLTFDEVEGHTHKALKDRLDPDLPPVHVLHFDGHGRFSRHCPHCQAWNYPHLLECGRCKRSLADAPAKGYLAFEKENKEAHWISTDDLLEGLLRSDVRLAILSSCQSARVRYADSLFGGIGPGLILGGIPAVVAIQFSILDSHAISFHDKFYKSLAQGKQITDAMYFARLQLPKPARWAPVLYLRSKDNQTHLCAPE